MSSGSFSGERAAVLDPGYQDPWSPTSRGRAHRRALGPRGRPRAAAGGPTRWAATPPARTCRPPSTRRSGGLRPRPTKLTTKRRRAQSAQRTRAEVDADEDRRRVSRDARHGSRRQSAGSSVRVDGRDDRDTRRESDAMISKNDCREIGTGISVTAQRSAFTTGDRDRRSLMKEVLRRRSPPCTRSRLRGPARPGR